MSKVRMIAGIAIGAAAGVVAGILTAPKSGADTRSDIKNKAVDLKDDAVHTGEKVVDVAKEKQQTASSWFSKKTK